MSFSRPFRRPAVRLPWRAARAVLAAGGMVLTSLLPGRAAPLLTEFLAENGDVIRDEDGEASDYVEIYNPDPVPCNLAGYTLTDDPAQPRRWTFPAVVLQPGEYRVVWASGKNRTAAKRPLHTNFRLEKNGGYLALHTPEGGTPLTVFAGYPPQVEDRSYGLYQPETVNPVILSGAACRWTVPAGPLPGWESPGFDDISWQSGASGIGFDRDGPGGPYAPLLGPGGDTTELMYTVSATAYVRIPFTLAGRDALSGLVLRIKCDDGFVAWINGARVASRLAPDTLTWNSAATGLYDDADAVVFEEFVIPAGLGSLRDGGNILAIQLMNGEANNVDLLLVPELEVRSLDRSRPVQNGYFLTATPGAANSLPEAGFTEDTRFDVDRGFFDSPFSLTISCGTPGATIYYTTDGSTPRPRTARIYTGPIPIARTTVVRAMADADARHPSNVDTQTYLFPADIVRQTAPADYPSTWGEEDNGFGSVFPIPADYAMDPGVVVAPAYAGLTEKALRESLPVVSLTTDKELLFNADGIYANGRSGSDEAPVSMELLGPGWPADLQIDAGVRIHGGNAREHPKKPLRLYFRKRYGTDKLRYPLFPESTVQRFDQLILRPGGHDGWAVPFGNSSTLLAYHGTYVRDQFLRLTETHMGRLSPRGRYVHLYLNGLYWGIYDLHERANADFYSSHLGGEPEDWDVVHHPTFVGEDYSQVDGSGASWEQVLALADEGIRDAADYQSLDSLVDLEDYIDYLIVRIWSGDYDWCGPIYLKNGTQEAEAGYFDNKNWYAARRSRGEAGRFLFHVWDAEMSMGTHLMLNRGLGQQPPWLSYYPPQRIAGFDSTRVGTQGSLAWPYAALRGYPPFRQKFADRLQKHFFHEGVMTTAANQARLDSLTAQLALPLVAESARWGDVNRFDPFDLALTPDVHWKPEIQWLRDTFIANRNALVLQQFQSTGLFPATPAPIVSPPGGTTLPGSRLELRQPGGAPAAIYYTLDGSDPSTFSPINRRQLVDTGTDCRWWVPTSSIGTTWRSFDGPSNSALWQTGRNGLGYDLDPDYRPFFLTDVGSAMRGLRASVYFRMEFTMESQEEIDSLTSISFEAQYDDGLVAAINGTVAVRASAPTNETFSSTATSARNETAAIGFTPFALNPATVRPLLRVGRNVLAVQALNQSASSSDLLCAVRLVAQSGGNLSPAPGALLYDPDQPPVVPGDVTLKARALVNGEWSALTESRYFSTAPASSRNLVPSQIHYRPAPPDAAEMAAGYADEGAFEFIELLNVSRAAVDLSGCFFTNGIQFDFAQSSITQLAAGARLILARNPEALRFRHPGITGIAGAFAGGSALSNSGERLRLQAADGSAVFDLTYNDTQPWPPAADGTGPSLILVNPAGLTNPANPLHWRPSTGPAMPGRADTAGFGAWIAGFHHNPASTVSALSGPLDDPDADGCPNLLEYASGTHPFDLKSFPVLTLTATETAWLLRFPLNPDAADAALILEEAASPEGPWTTSVQLAERPVPSAPALRQYETAGSGPVRFYRLRATLP